MKPSIAYIEQKFEEFNRQMFAGNLPKLPVELSNAKSFLGLCVCKKRRLMTGQLQQYDFKLRFSTRFDLSEIEIEDTIIHEMIHYYIGVNQLVDTSAHGPLFRHIMDTINQKFGRNISVSYKGTKEQKEQPAGVKRQWHVIAKVIFNNGKFGVKVLPRILSRILHYYKSLSVHPEVREIELYMSDNPYFNRYPNSSVLKVHIVGEREINENLRGAEKMECDGISLKRVI